MQRKVLIGVVVVGLVAGGGSGLLAQTNTEINAGIQFNFSLPGARSLGMGGAFIGLADDATAAFTNPAGLTQISAPEVTLEGRSWDYTTPFVDAGHAFGAPTGVGIDTVAGLTYGESSDSTNGLSFVSYVYPGSRWAVAIYRHELANFETSIQSDGPFGTSVSAPCTATDFSGCFRFFGVQADIDLSIVNTGVSGAIRFGDRFSLGIGASYYDFSWDSRTSRFDNVFFSPTDFTNDPIANSQTIAGDDTDVAINFGLRFAATDWLSIGAVYRQGPSFPFSFVSQRADGSIFAEGDGDFEVPDVYGVGLAFANSSRSFKAMVDYVHVGYSDLTSQVVNVFGPTFDDATQGLQVDDADELHLGLEYIFINMSNPLILRAGAWLDPDHQIRYDGATTTDVGRQLAILFPEGDDQEHFSAGVGFSFAQGKAEVNAAADFSDRVDTLSVSTVIRFF